VCPKAPTNRNAFNYCYFFTKTSSTDVMNTSPRRYVFIDFDNLQKIHPKKLSKVCEKAFVIVPAKQAAVPLALVVELQKFGKDLKWVLIDDDTSPNLHCYIAFLMGKLHEKVPVEIQFALLSDDEALDPLVRFINEAGRNCLRVKRSLANAEPTSTPPPVAKLKPITENILKPIQQELSASTPSATESLLPNRMERLAMEEDLGEINFSDEEVAYPTAFEPIELVKSTRNHLEYEIDHEHTDTADSPDIHKKAMDIIEKLVQSGNRPSEVSLLKYYALQHHENLGKNGTLQRVIEHLEATRYISLEESEITYHF
jgi:PIN domain